MTATVDTVLTASEVDQLAVYEQRIAVGLQTFVEVGTALASIRDNRLYRAEFDTFEEYCRERWGFNRHRASQLIGAVDVVTAVTSAGLPAPANEGQARELARVPEPERAGVWRETVERTDGKPTAAAIRAVHEERTQTPAPAPEPAAAGIDVTAAAGHPVHPPTPGEADARLDAAAGNGEREALTGGPTPVGAGGDSPVGLPDTPVGLDRPGPSTTEQDEHERRQRSSVDVATALVSLLLRLDPDPIRWLNRTWLPDAYRNRDMPRVRAAFTTDGLRLISKHLDTIADHLDSTGGSL